MKGIPHHLFGICDPLHRITIHEYTTLCLQTIQEIISRGKTPILVGGTNYYIESILFNTPAKERTLCDKQNIIIEDADKVAIENLLKRSNSNRLVRNFEVANAELRFHLE